jgi:S-DNA-T family DNA segregation ATPase FtsK/SpoIIIE
VQCAFIDTPEIEAVNATSSLISPDPLDPMELPEPDDPNASSGEPGVVAMA